MDRSLERVCTKCTRKPLSTTATLEEDIEKLHQNEGAIPQLEVRPRSWHCTGDQKEYGQDRHRQVSFASKPTPS